MSKKKITLIYGDGVGPEVISAACRIIEASGASIDWEVCEAGAEVFKRGIESGVPPETIESIKRNRVALKGPLETPVGYGEKSANVTLRKLFETFANVRPVREFPKVASPYQGRHIDFVIIRENVEDLYAGIEYMQTPGVAETLKIITRKGCEKIVRFAFAFARSEGRRKVQCATKANIMKFTEGLLKRTFEEIALEYPDIDASHIIVDNCAHQLVRAPENFDVIVTTNLNGDILSDLGSGLTGGLGLAPSANLGNEVAIFEAVHGSAPKYAGKNVSNPLAVIQAGVMMLRHLKEYDAALLIEQAILVTLEQGIATKDIVGEKKALGTAEFADQVIAHLGQSSTFWKPRSYEPLQIPRISHQPDLVHVTERKVIGLDIYIESGETVDKIAENVTLILDQTLFQLVAISNRGVKVYPAVPGVNPDLVDHWCLRVAKKDPSALTDTEALELLGLISLKHSWMHIEKLTLFDHIPGFSKSQGED